MSPQKSNRIFGMTSGQIAILAGIGITVFLLVGCLVIFAILRSQSTTTSNSSSLPHYIVNDVSDNGETNVAYFLVADKHLAKQDAEKIINYYRDIHIIQKGYKLINIWFFVTWYTQIMRPLITRR